MKLLMMSLLAASFIFFPQPSPSFQAKQAPMPGFEFIAEATVFRTSDRKDPRGRYLPPWKEVRIANIFSKAKPTVGSKVTVIPLGVDIAPFNLKIVKAEEQRFGCDEREPNSWIFDLESIKHVRIFEAEPLPNRRAEEPFDVCVISPAVAAARQLKREQLARGTLPKGVTINTVTAAIDLTNDKRPDVIIANFCCNNFSKSEGCDYTCGKTFLKVRGKWKLIDYSNPC
jgi:hypothetical protein